MVEMVRIAGWKDVLFKLLEGGQPLNLACQNAKIPMTKVFNEKSLDPVFATNLERAMKRGRGEVDNDGSGGQTGAYFGRPPSRSDVS